MATNVQYRDSFNKVIFEYSTDNVPKLNETVSIRFSNVDYRGKVSHIEHLISIMGRQTIITLNLFTGGKNDSTNSR